VRLASALLLSAGAHLTAFSVAGSLEPPASAASAPVPAVPLRAVLVAARSEAEPAPAQRAEPRPPEAPPAKRYLALAQLDVRPQVKSHVMPRYPEHVLPGTRGRVVLELLIAADGSVDTINVERAEPGGVFEEAAVKAFSQARFSPAMKRGAAVPAVLRVEVSFGD
jgi:protein TonB